MVPAEVTAMPDQPTRATIYFDADLHQALRLKAAGTHRSISELVNDAVRQALAEDQDDLEANRARSGEAALSFEALLSKLRKQGKL
jgi:plasmid stability protein